MAEKPSLYVVERKEVVILVVLFILVTVLSFTVGVRYGEKMGRQLNHEEASAQSQVEDESVDKTGGGTLTPGKPGALAKLEKSIAEGGKLDENSPEKLAKASEAAGKKEGGGKLELKNSVDSTSDAALLLALKDAGVEPPSGKSPSGLNLPDEIKSPTPGSFVIQVGSHPTKREAEEQVRSLKGGSIDAQILPAFKDKQGEWFRVVISGYKNKNEAEKDGKQLKNKGLIRSYFVRKM